MGSPNDVEGRDPTFEISSFQRDGTVRLWLAGELDILTAPELTEAVEAAASGGRRIVVDLAGVSFIDSSGLDASGLADRFDIERP